MPEDVITETPVEQLQRVLGNVRNTKAWASARVDRIENDITALGGEPSAPMRDLIEQIRSEAQ